MSDDSGRIVRALGKSGGVLFLGTLLEVGISFLAKLIVATRLDVSSYGSVVVGLTVLTMLGLVVRLGLSSGVASLGPRYSGTQRRDIYLSAYTLLTVASIGAAAALYLTAPILAARLGNPSLAPVFRVFSLSVPAVPLMRLSVGVTQAEQRSGPKVVVQNLLHPLARIVLLLVVVEFGATAITVASAYVLANWLGALVGFWFAVRSTDVLSLGTTSFVFRYRELLALSVPLMLSSGMMYVIGETDNLIIEVFGRTADVASYDIGYTIGNTLTIGLSALSFLFLPIASGLYQDGQSSELRRYYALISKWVVFITLLPYLGVVLFPSAAIVYTFGSKYGAGAPILVLIASTYFAHSVAGPNKELLTAMGETRFIMWANAFVAVLNLVLNILLVPLLGIVGAAVASFASFVPLNLLYLYRLRREIAVSPITRQSLLPAAVCSLVLCAAALALHRSFGSVPPLSVLVTFAAASPIVLAVSILAFGGIQPEDVLIVNAAEQRLGVDLEPVKSVARRFM